MPRQVDHDTRRAELCEVVIDLASRDGFAAVTIRAIAAASGTSTSSITHYFSSREELISLTVRGEVARHRARIEAATHIDALGALRAMASAVVLGTTERDRRLWIAIVTGSIHDPVLARELDVFNSWWDSVTSRLLAASGLASEAAARFADLVDVVVAGVITASFESPTHWTAERRERTLHTLFDAISPAIRN